MVRNWHKSENPHKRNMPQLSNTGRATALALREAGWTQIAVARRLGVNVRTIKRLEADARTSQPGVVTLRKPGSGKSKKWGEKEKSTIAKLCEDQPGITANQMKLRCPKELGKLSRRTVSRIARVELGLKSCVRAKKPYLTDAKKLDRRNFAAKHQKWSRTKWGQYLFADEAFFWTKHQACGNKVRRPEGMRYDPKYTEAKYKKPQKLLFWAGITRSGKRISGFLDDGAQMNSENFVKLLKKSRVPAFLKKNKLKLLQDRATPHTSAATKSYLNSVGVKGVLLIPGTSPDFNPIENLFSRMKQMLDNRPIRTLAELKSEVKRVWKSLPRSFIASLINSMPNRMKIAAQNGGNPTKY